MEQKPQKSKECPRSSILDFNLSWVLMLVYLGYLLGIWFAQQATISYIPSSYSNTAYFLISALCGIVLTFVLYNLGKILFAKISGYQLIYMNFLGFNFERNANGGMSFRYDIMSFFDVGMQFSPKDDDVNKNPKKIFWGGFIMELLIIAAALLIFFLNLDSGRTTRSAIGWTFLFSMSYGFLTPLYEILPFRQDNPTDMFNLLSVATKEDMIAYNIVQINKKRELTGENFLTYEFENYESFYKARVLYPNYLEHLYASRLEKAFNVLENMKYYNKFYNDNDRYIPFQETIYLRYVVDDENGADQVYLSMKKDDKRLVTSPSNLADFRTALLVAGFISQDKERVLDVCKDFDELIQSFGEQPSTRVVKEKELFNSGYRKIMKAKPSLELPER